MRSAAVAANLPVISTSLIEIAEMPITTFSTQQGQVLQLLVETIDPNLLLQQDLDAARTLGGQDHTFYRGRLSEGLKYTQSELETCLSALDRLSHYVQVLSSKNQKTAGRAIRPMARLAIEVATAVNVIHLDESVSFASLRTPGEERRHVRKHFDSYLLLKPLMTRDQRERILDPAVDFIERTRPVHTDHTDIGV